VRVEIGGFGAVAHEEGLGPEAGVGRGFAARAACKGEEGDEERESES
jgi:hypothetical protein